MNRPTFPTSVLIGLDPTDAIVMSPRLTAGASLVIDRHYNSLKPYRKGEFNMYAVLKNDTCAVRYAGMNGRNGKEKSWTGKAEWKKWKE